MGFIGKYVCYGNHDGLFCFGRIKDEVEVNTVDGPKKAFILERRMSGPYPSFNCGSVVRRHKGDSIIRLDQLDMSRDISDEWLKDLSDELLFLWTLKCYEVGGDKVSHLGLKNMANSNFGGEFTELAKEELKKRLGVGTDD